MSHNHTIQAPADEAYWIDGCAIEYGYCTDCGAPCDENGCTVDPCLTCGHDAEEHEDTADACCTLCNCDTLHLDVGDCTLACYQKEN